MKIDQLSNGLTVIIEPIKSVASIAIRLSFPGGVAYDEESLVGASLVLTELTAKGAGKYSSQELADEFDLNGIAFNSSVSNELYSYTGRCLPEQLRKALSLISLVILEPKLTESDIPSIVSNYKQELSGLKDNPARRARIELNKIFIPDPYNRSGLPTEIGLDNCTHDNLKKIYSKYFSPRKAILSIAGNIPENILEMIKEFFGSWDGPLVEDLKFTDLSYKKFKHVQEEAAQLQICYAFPAAKFGAEDYYVNKVATEVLSGGMFGRLFIEVREKRGLCYSVYAGHSSNNDFGQISVYAGTTPERAHETLKVSIDTIKSISESLDEVELERAKANYLASLILAEESVSGRAASNVMDYILLKRIRPITEFEEKINAVNLDDIRKFSDNSKLSQLSLVTIGSKNIRGENGI